MFIFNVGRVLLNVIHSYLINHAECGTYILMLFPAYTIYFYLLNTALVYLGEPHKSFRARYFNPADQ
jgi:hypothetical protein